MSSWKQQPTNRYEGTLLKSRRCNARGALTDRTDARRYVCVSGDFHLETGHSVPDS